MGVGCPCPPIHNYIVTPRHLFLSLPRQRRHPPALNYSPRRNDIPSRTKRATRQKEQRDKKSNETERATRQKEQRGRKSNKTESKTERQKLRKYPNHPKRNGESGNRKGKKSTRWVNILSDTQQDWERVNESWQYLAQMRSEGKEKSIGRYSFSYSNLRH